MRTRPTLLINTPAIEIWPAHLLRARSNADARLLARARHVLRRKRDGRFLAASTGAGIESLLPGWRREPGVDVALRELRNADAPHRHGHDLPSARIAHRLHALGLDAAAYEARTGLALVAEPAALAFAGFDRYRRPLWLRATAARDWHRLQGAARRDGILLEAISGYRSHDYQLGIFERKLGRGQDVDTILTVNAAPGYSEHHSGRALDISAPGEPPAEESFEATPAFAWLRDNAAAFDFVMSYPRDNPHGIVYEPWHWCHRG
jgi:D-alanyl-D-alanine carboxypeptidase